ncbi:MAG TPA: iron-sulfur cluster assembly scaffold protein, partial [Steroidobacteraceae bacterium]|nr:iron-sulfur cluster assembly scaffold protein [Steroidobacteraceae bacterium]
IDGVEGEALLLALCDLAISSGSACASTHAQPSYVLRALGHSDRLAQSSLRLSLGRFTTADEVEFAASRVREEVLRLRDCRPRAGEGPPPPTDDARYSGEVYRRFDTLAGAGRLAPSAHKLTGKAGNREQGCEIEIEFAIEAGRVSEAAFVGFGCPHALAAASWLTEQARGWTRDQMAAWDWQEAARALEVPPAKFGRLLTLQDAVRNAARNWASESASTV